VNYAALALSPLFLIGLPTGGWRDWTLGARTALRRYLLLSSVTDSVRGRYSEPDPELSRRNFANALAVRARAFAGLKLARISRLYS